MIGMQILLEARVDHILQIPETFTVLFTFATNQRREEGRASVTNAILQALRDLESTSCTTGIQRCLLPKICQLDQLIECLLDDDTDTELNVPRMFALLQGSGNLLVGLLPHDTLTRVEERVDAALRSKAHEGGVRTLYCLAVMQILLESTAQHSLGADMPATSQPSRSERTRSFFERRASKTIQLVVLQAVWACQAEEDLRDSRMTALRLGSRIIAAIPSEAKRAWCIASPTVIAKLQKKALASSPEFRILAAAFISRLCGTKIEVDLTSVSEDVSRMLLDPDTSSTIHNLTSVHTLCAKNKYDALQQAYDDLEAKNIDDRLIQTDLERELVATIAEKDALKLRNIELAQKRQGETEKLSRELESWRLDLARKVAETAAMKDDIELERITLAAKWNEEKEDELERHTAHATEISRLEEEVRAMKEDYTDTTAAHQCEADDLKNRVARITAEQEAARVECSALNEKLDTADLAISKLAEELDTLREDQIRIFTTNENEIQEFKQQVKDINVEKEAVMSECAMMSEKLGTAHMKISELEEEMCATRQDYEQQIAQLQRDANEKDHRISEADALRNTLLATLGATQTLPLRSRGSSSTQS
ncbi:hypothetical protein LTR62_004622 [Meristemomyces frigidus]|uniref:Uncharacterized protein n=1 Tax=Meristemomyces frigidus TaxID=1508187 RepID=A0AAN7TDP7_9PEZI|nr:hypothetical protein LTR62_004622 [Meristemomyces frigidus]